MAVKSLNKRVFRRVHSSMTPVKIECDTELCFGYIRDISCFGISTFGLKPLTVDKEYELEFTLPEVGVPVRCMARVKWNRIHTQSFVSVCRQGLMFEDIDPDLSQMIDDWINRELPRVVA